MADIAAERSEQSNAPEVELVSEVDIGGPLETAAPEASTSASPQLDNDSSKDPDVTAGTSTGARDSSAGQTSKRTQDGGAQESNLPPTKRTRTAGGGAQRRLFGVLTKTLNRFQEETKKDTDASKRRAELEERLAAKKREENEAIEAKTGHERARRNLRFDIMKKEDEKSAFIAIYKIRKSSKISLANFLCTKAGDTSAEASSSSSSNIGSLKPPPLPELPHALGSTSTHSSSSTKPLYYLPYKLLPWQADKIDGQVEDMKIELDKEEDEWKEELAKREIELADMKAKLSDLIGSDDRHTDNRERRAPRRDNDRDADMSPGLAERAPLPERDDMDELNGDARAGSLEPRNDGYRESSAMATEGDDKLEY